MGLKELTPEELKHGALNPLGFLRKVLKGFRNPYIHVKCQKDGCMNSCGHDECKMRNVLT